MKRFALVIGTLVVLLGIGWYVRPRLAVHAGPQPQTGQASSGTALTPDALDRLLAPIALYPDQLLAQMLLCAMDPAGVKALDQFLKSHATLKGTELQDAALKDSFEPSFVAMALFPQVVSTMATQIETTTRIGQAFATDKTAFFASIQRLRKQAKDAGNLKTTPQQEVETKSTSTGQEVIVIEPANPQVVYVPQYNTQTVYVQQPATTTVVVQDNSTDAAVAGMIGFTAGIAIGAAVSNPYYYGPYGWHGGAYMYNDAWDDYYDHREDAREDWTDHREDLAEDRGERRSDTQEQRTERQENRTENRPESQQQRTERQQTRQENRPERQAQGQQQRSSAQTASPSSSSATRGSGNYESRGYTQGQGRTTTQQRSGTGSDAFSGYSNGKSERAASTRGQSSRSSSRSGGSRSGGGGRRR
jgi:uncharacterized protein DUF3300